MESVWWEWTRIRYRFQTARIRHIAHSALGAYCRRMCGRLGTPKGIVAAAHKLAVLVYRMLKFGHQYTDIGQERYEQQYKQRVLQRLSRKALDFGFQLVPCPEKQVP